MNQKQISAFIGEQKTLCNAYKRPETNEYHASTSVSLTMEQAFRIYKNGELMTLLKEQGWTWNPSYKESKGLVTFSIVKLVEVNHDSLWDSTSELNKKIHFKTGIRISMQKQVRDDISILLGLIKPSKTSEKVESLAIEKTITALMKILSISRDEAIDQIKEMDSDKFSQATGKGGLSLSM